MDISLALGGGGIKGFAHVGVIRFLEKNGFRIRAIAGSSAGGMVGSVYAAGYTADEMVDHLLRLDQSRLYHRLPGDGPSLLGLGGVVSELKVFLGDRNFDQLQIPFACTAVDLDSGRLLILNQGKVLDAVQATIALPGIFPPRYWGGRTLVDGAILDPIPIALARSLAKGLPVVAVVLTPTMDEWENSRQNLLSSMPFIGIFSQFRLAQSLNIFLRSVDMAGCLLTDLKIQTEKPEVLIRPPVNQYGVIDHVEVAELIKIGEEATEAALPALQRAVGWRQKISYHLPWLSDFIWVDQNDA